MIVAVLFMIFSQQIVAKNYKTEALVDEIHSIQVLNSGQWNSYPIINLNTSDQIYIDFDKVSDDLLTRMRYKIVYCNADWTINRNLSEMEYLEGFNDNVIDDYAASFNTTVSYTHYSLKIPNNEVNLKLSGNYTVLVYDENEDEDEILLTACFSVLDSKVNIVPKVSSITDIDANDKNQQVSFELKYNFPIRDPQNDLKVSVRQNNRLDNKRKDIKPTYIQSSVLRYEHNRNLIFAAGNEYNRFDISSRRSNGMNVARIDYRRPFYYMYVIPSLIKTKPSYSYDQDQNGRVIYRNLDADDINIEGDYFYTYFTLQADDPLPNDVYINGAFTNNTFSEKYKMKYDRDNREYNLTLLLKQGIYNYQYLTNGSTEDITGNFHETENEYTVYVYYRPSGQLYDSFIGFSLFQSRAK